MGTLVNETLQSDYLISQVRINNLNVEQELTLKSLVTTYLIMVRDSQLVNKLIDYLIPEILKLERTYNHNLFEQLIDYVYNENKDIDKIINNYLVNGYYYHTTHEKLADSIIDNNPKPWDEKKLFEIQNLFKNKGKHDVFGLYVSKSSLFIAPSLQSSAYYGMTSPSWFTHFTSGGLEKKKDYEKFGYYNRNYDVCLSNIIKLCREYNLNDSEREMVLNFFEECYVMFGNCHIPKVLLINRTEVRPNINILARNNNESDLTYLKRMIHLHCNTNQVYKKPIKKDNILLIDYKEKERKKIL